MSCPNKQYEGDILSEQNGGEHMTEIETAPLEDYSLEYWWLDYSNLGILIAAAYLLWTMWRQVTALDTMWGILNKLNVVKRLVFLDMYIAHQLFAASSYSKWLPQGD